MEMISLLLWPLIATLTLPWLLVYFGLHIVRRGVIFVDLALAQTAAFGTCVAMVLGFDVHDWQNYALSLGFTLAGAALLTFTRARNRNVPQEALIGIIYVVAAAASILALSKSAGGKEELQRSLVGELLVVPPVEVVKTIVLFAVIGLIHFIYRKPFIAISEDHDGAAARGLRVRWWDFIFYMSFGPVVTSFVHIGGVLLAFSYLVIPAVCAVYLAGSLSARFAVGTSIATVASVVSLAVTTQVDLPVGAAIVCVLGVCLVFVTIGVRLFKRTPGR